MIPRAKLTNQVFGNATKVRVTACRRRLRDHRSIHRMQTQEVERDRDSQHMAQFPADSAAVRQLASLDLSPAFGYTQVRTAAESVVEQEVGIT